MHRLLGKERMPASSPGFAMPTLQFGSMASRILYQNGEAPDMEILSLIGKAPGQCPQFPISLRDTLPSLH